MAATILIFGELKGDTNGNFILKAWDADGTQVLKALGNYHPHNNVPTWEVDSIRITFDNWDAVNGGDSFTGETNGNRLSFMTTRGVSVSGNITHAENEPVQTISGKINWERLSENL
ncbi:hypothetical protein RSOLAG22IIIB_10107 [Rhizoctonia solani]|uniref:Uncharacterized protein n=1 Tax=Rhizoctonia solani TaxID=456999 RepID=A0A0K6G0R0_9AGAM|nr:hypothetical protein RSOLAG22IIIB_10107 [Rhizoctonia solani]